MTVFVEGKACRIGGPSFFGCVNSKRRGMYRIGLSANQKRRTLARCAAVAGRLTDS